MGFDEKPSPPTVAAEPLWRQYRDEFPVTQNLIYLNHAAVSPLPRHTAVAMQALAQDALDFGSLHYDRWLDTYEAVRVAAAQLIGANRNEIALMKNTSEGISTVARGLDWRPGDRIVAFREEFPSNYYPWLRLESQRCYVEWLSAQDPLEKIDNACTGAKLLAISFVQYLSGFRVDLNAIGEICKRHHCFFFVDAIQGLGAFPLNVETAHIDALAADGHKWLLGPEGCAILYVRKSRQDSIFPEEFGWTTVAGYHDYSSRDMALRQDAGRYECGTLNTIGCYGLQASLELLREVGTDRTSVRYRIRRPDDAEARARLRELASVRRRFRIQAVVDDFTRECLTLVPDTSLPGLRVARELDALIAARGRPAMCVSDNGH